MFDFYSNPAECRSCDMPKMQDEESLIQCKRCYDKSRAMKTSLECAQYIVPVASENRTDIISTIAVLPYEVLYPIAIQGWKLVMLAPGIKLPKPKHQSSVAISAIAAALGIEQKEESEDCACAACGQYHEDGSYAKFAPNRVLYIVNGTTNQLLLHSVIIILLRSIGNNQLREQVAALQTVQEINVRYQMRIRNVTEAEDDVLLPYIISKLALGDWDDYGAQLFLAYCSLLDVCSRTRLSALQPEAVRFMRHTMLELADDCAKLRGDYVAAS